MVFETGRVDQFSRASVVAQFEKPLPRNARRYTKENLCLGGSSSRQI